MNPQRTGTLFQDGDHFLRGNSFLFACGHIFQADMIVSHLFFILAIDSPFLFI